MMSESHGVDTPLSTSTELLKSDCPVDRESVEDMKNIPYSQAVGAVMYNMLGTRPDLAFSITALSQFMQNPGQPHWIAMKRLFRYLNRTQQYQLTYQPQAGSETQSLTVHGFTDSDWGNDKNDRRSITGWVFMLYGGAVSWQSRKQRTVTLSSVEAEYMAATQATKEAIWWRSFLTELGLPPLGPTIIYADNQGSIALAKNPEHHERTKHIDIQYHFIREQLATRAITVQYMPTEDMVADVLTKALASNRHNQLISRMGVHNVRI